MRLRLTNRISPLLSGGNGEGDVEHLRELLVRISKHAKREMDQELDSEQPIPTEAVLTRTDPTHLGRHG